MNKKLVNLLVFISLIIAGGYIFIKFKILKAKDFKPDTKKQKNIVDLRPSIIAKLQQLVKDGSTGLYVLSIEKINPDVLASKIDLVNASIHIDTVAMLQLDSLKKLPDDIFIVHFDSLHIDRIGIDDLLLHKNRIDIAGINITKPIIEVYHKTRAYNKAQRERNDTLSLYNRIKGQMNTIKIGNINIDNGTFINYQIVNKKIVTKLNQLNIHINDLQIDSSTQFDASRFLFAKHVTMEAKNYMIPTSDSLYYFKIGTVSVLAEQRKISFLNVELKPRGNKIQFESKLQYRKMMYQIAFPRITLSDVDWQAMMNYEKFISKKAEIWGGLITIFFDRSLPKSPFIQIDNYPHQKLMKIPFPVSISNLNLKHVNISYEEYNPDAKRSGTVFFNNITGQLYNLSNMHSDIKKYPIAKFSVSGLFMHHIPIKARFTFNLLKYKTGEFTADVHMDTLDKATINPLSEPLGLVSIKSGQMQQGTAHIEGNNFNAKSKVAISYTGLHINPLKKADENGQLKKKHLTSFIANVFLLKDSNPLKGKELRQPLSSVERGHYGNFFHMIWITILTGILKTIGIPVKFGIH
jgi:hypothetical protein